MTLPRRRRPTHPGEMLLVEFLRPRRITQVAAAAAMGMPPNRINELIRGKRGITASSALKLSRFLDTTPRVLDAPAGKWEVSHALDAERKAS